MRTVRTVAELRSALAPSRREQRTIGLVPTMGALHVGHLSLVEHAREQCDVVVVSLFVNPAQFNERADLERYPRDEQRDAELAGAAGADILFAPSVEAVYPSGFATTVEVLGVTERLEGAARGSEHFRGVATVVTKLLCMAMPDVAYFGQKDAQQVVVIRRLAADLNLPVRIEALPTVREPDGLALSSRNALLSTEDRARALALHAALQAASALAASGERTAAALLGAAREAMRPFDVEPEYVALVEPDTLEPVTRLAGETLLAVAARIGEVRLIDNALLTPAARQASAAAQQPTAARDLDQSQTPSQPLEGEAIATCSA
jgi:pantoate--beta-alanine ligase